MFCFNGLKTQPKCWLHICLAIAGIAISGSIAAAEFRLQTSHTSVAEGEHIKLIYSYDERVKGGERPDFSPLKNNFDILSISPTFSRSSINGQVTISQQWTLLVIPKRKGTLLVAPISFKGQSTQPINISVGGDVSKDMFIETLVDKSSAYVDEHIILSVRLFHSSAVDRDVGPDISAIDTLLVTELPTDYYQSEKDGRTYYILEYNYLLQAPTEGVKTIPKLNWDVRVLRGGFGRYQLKRRQSEEKLIRIKPIPDSYPSGAAWLPAQSVSIDGRWSDATYSMNIGVPNTLTIQLKTQGLRASTLPELLQDYTDTALKIYAEKPAYDEGLQGQVVHASLEQNAAIILNQAGGTTFPEIRLPWWNIDDDKLEYAVLPANKLIALDNAAGTPSTSNNTKSSASLATTNIPNASSTTGDLSEVTSRTSHASEKMLWVLWITNIATFIALIIALVLLLARKKGASGHAESAMEASNKPSTKAQLASLNRAQKIGDWGSVYKQISELSLQAGISYQQLVQTAAAQQAQDFADALTELENALFSKSSDDLNIQCSLSDGVKAFIFDARQAHDESVLPALYS